MRKDNNYLNACKYCGSSSVVKYGLYHGIQLYWCKICKRKFKQGSFPFHSKVSSSKICNSLIMYFCNKSINSIRVYLRNEHDYYPSKSVIVNWIKKYTELAQKSLNSCQPIVGDQWIIVETKVNKNKKNIYLLDIIDYDTRYLLSTCLISEKDSVNIPELIGQAIKTGGKTPISIKWKNTLLQPDLKGLFHFPNFRPHLYTSIYNEDLSQNISEAFIPKERTEKLIRLRSVKSALQFLGKYNIHYNYFQPSEALGGNTPAKAAGIKYPYKTWANIINKTNPEKRTHLSA